MTHRATAVADVAGSDSKRAGCASVRGHYFTTPTDATVTRARHVEEGGGGGRMWENSRPDHKMKTRTKNVKPLMGQKDLGQTERRLFFPMAFTLLPTETDA